MARRRRRALLKRVRDRMLRFFTCGHRRLDNDGDDSYLAQATHSASSENGEAKRQEGSGLEIQTQCQSAKFGECTSTEDNSGEAANLKNPCKPESSVENPKMSPKPVRRRVSRWELDVKRDLQEVADCSKMDIKSLVKKFEGEKSIQMVAFEKVINKKTPATESNDAENVAVEKVTKVDADVTETIDAKKVAVGKVDANVAETCFAEAIEETVEVEATVEMSEVEEVTVEKDVHVEAITAETSETEVGESNVHLETNALEENVDGKSRVELFATEMAESALETAIGQVKAEEQCIQEAAESMAIAAIDVSIFDLEEERVQAEMVTNEAKGLIKCVLTNVSQEPEFQERVITEEEVSTEANGLIKCVLTNVSQEPEFQERVITEEEVSTEAKGLIKCVLTNVSQEPEFQERVITEEEVSTEANGLIKCVLTNVLQEPEFQESVITEEEVSTEAKGLIKCVLTNVSQEPEFQERVITEEEVSTEANGLIKCVLTNVSQEPEFQERVITEEEVSTEAKGLIKCVLTNVTEEQNEIQCIKQSPSEGQEDRIDSGLKIAQESSADDLSLQDAIKVTEDQTCDERVITIYDVDDMSDIDEDVVEDRACVGTAAVSTLSQVGETEVVDRVTEVAHDCTTKPSFASAERVGSEAKSNLRSLHAKISQLTHSEKRLDTEITPKNRGLGKIPSGKVESLIRKFSVHGN